MRAPLGFIVFLLACLMAAVVPLRSRPEGAAAGEPAFPGWPESFEGRPLSATGLNAAERAFGERFPGRMGRFSDGSRLVVLRWVTAPTHNVHSGANCLETIGYKLKPGDWRRDPDGVIWSTWTAEGPDGRLLIRERCHDGRGRSWPDVSTWFWAAVMGRTEGPWWVVTVAERQ
jgi:hypothetical protein